jgi:hypothetical protein
MVRTSHRFRRALLAGVAAGLIAAMAEMIIVIPVQAALGVSPARVFQFIASGALGKAAYVSGAFGVAFGIAAHLLISLLAAGLYVAALFRIQALDRHPVVGGATFGLLVYLAMTFVVVPLSRIGMQPLPTPVLGAVSLAVHLFAFGVPLAFVATLLLRACLGHRACD